METPAVLSAKWWLAFWEGVEHWAFFGVVLALAIEFAAAHFVKSPRRIVEAAHEKEVAALNKRAAEAELELAKIKTPRSLSPAQEQQFIEAMKEFSGVPFDFSIQPNPETIKLMQQVGDCLKKAGLVWQPVNDPPPSFSQPGYPKVAMVAFSGFAVQYDTSKLEQWEAPAARIVALLRSFGLAVEGKRIIDNSVSTTAIHLYVGEKPI